MSEVPNRTLVRFDENVVESIRVAIEDDAVHAVEVATDLRPVTVWTRGHGLNMVGSVIMGRKE